MSSKYLTGQAPAKPGSLSARVMDLVNAMEGIIARGRKPDFDAEKDLKPLADLLAVDEFERLGPFHDCCNWDEYSKLITDWVTTSEGWRPVFKRMNESPGVVYLELDEMVTHEGNEFPFHSLSVYEFNDDGKIRRIDVYMQQEQQESAG